LWGVAYCVSGGAEKEADAIKYLERRECEYDKKISVAFYKGGACLSPAITGVLVFVSTPDRNINKYYLGPAPLDQMARQIATANGPCGNNREYLFSLEKALFDIGHEEDYVIVLANEVRKVLTMQKEKKSKMSGPHLSVRFNLSPVHLLALREATVVESG